jgi:hypothetical protein
MKLYIPPRRLECTMPVKHRKYISDIGPNTKCIVIEINNFTAGMIIGTGGRNINNIRCKYDSSIEISRNITRTVTISGPDKFIVFGIVVGIMAKNNKN